MRKALATFAISVLGAVAAAGPVAAPAQPVAQVSCVSTPTPGGTKCLAAGQFCSHKAGYAQAYKNAGFKCKANGHLTYR